MPLPWTQRFYRPQHRNKVMWVALCVLLILAITGSLLSTFIIQAVRVNSGALLWKYSPGKSEALFTMVDEMNVSTVITNTDSSRVSYYSVVALNTKNGTKLWQNSLNGFGGIVAFVHRLPSYSDFKQRLCALQTDTGTSLWCHDADGLNNWVIAAT